MAVPATCEQFLELIEKSTLVDAERLAQYIAKQPLPSDPRDAANRLWRDGLLTFYQAKMLLSGKYKGFVFGKYKVLEEIGAGGEGKVYLCQHLLMQRRVAVKVLPIDRAADAGLLERFYREARAAAALDHPNIVRVHDVDQEGELHFLVMEYVDGNSLQKIVKKKGPMEILRAVNYVRHAAVGLQHVHTAGLVHRDIKPGNLLLDRQGTVKLLDLGLARFFHDHQDHLTRQYDESAVLGTADYISPEQGMNSHSADIRADIYSLGSTFYFLLAGRPPFDGGTVTQKLLFHQMREPEPVRNLRVAVPEGMADVLAKMMAKDPKNRYQTPAEVVEALAPWQQELPPPPEDEMPKLSAASNFTPGEAGPISRTLSQLNLNSAIRRQTPGPISSGRIRAEKTSAPAPLPTAELLPVPRPPTPRTGGAVAPTKAKVQVVVRSRQTSEAMADTDVPRAADTKAIRKPLKKRRLRLKSASLNRKIQYLIGGCFGATILGVAGYFLLPLMIGSYRVSQPVDTSAVASTPGKVDVHRPDQGPRRESAVFTVSKHAGFKTVGEVLARATAGSTIQIFSRDGIHEEVLHIDKPIPNDITIVADNASGHALVWRAPANARNDEPLVRVTNAEGLKFKGFAFDGQGRLDDLLVISGRCPGVTLEETPLSGFRRHGVVFRGCTAEPRKPASIVRARITASRDSDSGVVFEGGASKDIDVRDCRFEGGFRSAIQLAGPVDGVGIQRNRFYRAQTGLLYRKSATLAKARVDLVSNTFYDVTRGLHFQAIPPGGDKHEFVVQQNLFAHVPTPVQVDDFSPEPDIITAQWIWFNEGDPLRSAPSGACHFRKKFTLPEQTFAGVTLSITCDDQFTVWINGKEVGSGDFAASTRRVHSIDVSKFLHSGDNAIAVRGMNRPDNRSSPTPAGLLVQLGSSSGPNPVLLGTDGSWKCSKTNDPGWQSERFDDHAWQPVRVLASYGKGDPSWQNLVWDAAVGSKFKVGSPFQNPAANYRDGTTKVAFPPLDWKTSDSLTLPTDGSKEREFLRYPRNHALAKAGPNQTPIGVPPAD